MQHADHFTRILNERESFRRDKFSGNKPENNSYHVDENIENSGQNSNKDVAETSSEDVKIQKSLKSQAEIN